MEEISLVVAIRKKVKKYLKWYSYPLVYFLITSLVCAYAWYTRPIPHRAGIKVVFKTISLIPTLIWTGAITVCIVIAILLLAISFWLKKRFPELSIWNRSERFSQSREDSLQEPSSSKKVPISLWRKVANVFFSVFGIIFIVTGVSLAIWISRPYITLLLSSSKIEALENKVKFGQVQGNRIIIPSVLVDAPIIEGVSKGQLSRGVCHIAQSQAPGKGGNCIIEGHNLAEFGWWKPQSFFSLLEAVDKGTPVYVFYNGGKYIYKVQEKTYRDISDPNLYDITPRERLTLITCVSTWSPTIYTNKRTVVIAYPVSDQIQQNH